MPDTFITQYMYAFELCILQSAFLHVSQSTVYSLLWSAAHSLLFTLTIFSLISVKMKVKSEHLLRLLNYIGHQRIFNCTVGAMAFVFLARHIFYRSCMYVNR